MGYKSWPLRMSIPASNSFWHQEDDVIRHSVLMEVTVENLSIPLWTLARVKIDVQMALLGLALIWNIDMANFIEASKFSAKFRLIKPNQVLICVKVSLFQSLLC